jgi:hypothetical protein
MAVRQFVRGLREKLHAEVKVHLITLEHPTFDSDAVYKICLALEEAFPAERREQPLRRERHQPKSRADQRDCSVHGKCGQDDSQCRAQTQAAGRPKTNASKAERPNPNASKAERPKAENKRGEGACYHCGSLGHRKFERPHINLAREDAGKAASRDKKVRAMRVRRARVYSVSAEGHFATPLDLDFRKCAATMVSAPGTDDEEPPLMVECTSSDSSDGPPPLHESDVSSGSGDETPSVVRSASVRMIAKEAAATEKRFSAEPVDSGCEAMPGLSSNDSRGESPDDISSGDESAPVTTRAWSCYYGAWRSSYGTYARSYCGA